jgi:hypothetical protein
VGYVISGMYFGSNLGLAEGGTYFPVIALIIASLSLIAMTTLNIKLSLIYFAILALTYIWFHFFLKRVSNAR